MDKFKRYFYYLVTIIFAFLTLFELYIYLKLDSNYMGVFYLLINFFIMFLLCSVSFNYEEKNIKIRVSKNIISIIFGLFSSFVMYLLVSKLYSYVDASSVFNSSIFVVSKIIKPIIYFMLLGMSICEIRMKIK